MNVLFIGKGSIGPRYLMHALKTHGHNAYGIYENVPNEFIVNKQIDLVGFSSTTMDVEEFYRQAQTLKLSFPALKIIFGGIHATLFPEEVLSQTAIDFICRGEGEDAIVELCGALATNSPLSQLRIPNIWTKDERGQIIRTELRPLERDIDRFQLCRENFLYHGFYASRGCIGNCTFCAAPQIKRLAPGPYFRMRSVDNVIAEIHDYYQKVPWPHKIENNQRQELPIRFKDDNFVTNKKWLGDFVSKFRHYFPGRTFVCQLRADCVDEEVANLLRAGGCVLVSIGFEAGSERIRNEILGKHTSNQTIYRAAQLLKDVGIQIMGQWIVGSPTETFEELMQSVEMHCQINDLAQVHIATPYPGTKLYQMAKDMGFNLGEVATSLYDKFYFHQAAEEKLFRAISHLFPIMQEKVSNYHLAKVLGGTSFTIQDKSIFDLITHGGRQS